MGTEVALPQDCLLLLFPPLPFTPNSNSNSKPNPNLTRKRRSLVAAKHKIPVNILNSGDDLRLRWPKHDLTPKRVRFTGVRHRADEYAGSAFALSPPPRSLPVPRFCRKEAAVDLSATRDLRRLLRLD